MEQRYDHRGLQADLCSLHRSREGRALVETLAEDPPHPWGGRQFTSPSSTSLPVQPLSHFCPVTAPFQCIKRKLLMNLDFTTFISLPTFKMPNTATCPGGSNFISYPECHHRNSLQTPLTDWFLLLQRRLGCQASETKGLTSFSLRSRHPLVLKSQAATSTS